MNKDNKEIAEEDDISEIIKSSAINKKNPGLFSDNKNIKENIHKTKMQIIKDNLLLCINDFIVGKKEDYLIKKNGSSSERAIKETMLYYKSLYISKNPDLDNLLRLIKRNKAIVEKKNKNVYINGLLKESMEASRSSPPVLPSMRQYRYTRYIK